MFFKFIRRWTIIKKKLEVNESIRDREVRLIDSNGEQLGVVSSRRALEIAEERKLDLVKIAPNAKPPVCKVMDFGKYKYEQAKREKEAKKKQKTISVKEVRLSLNIEDHDLNTKANNAMKFLEKGDKVKVSLRFKGRELGHTHLGKDVLNKFFSIVSEVATIDKSAKMEGRSMVMFLSPKN
ncbi:translation initiation factor IF-3 [Maledivibacter halophilus]|uniref:Translation initiation factor IF-3 n=1 Tax=Maledivibacter halophilus TaxID=36842 RepID=A0A1T5IWG4_9FIRM|nr:translation initiation factor IF-3 [Maledivibacter halophilus]SKC43510.1 bacterial translation initiation factor 3 (bIF-3) [Maledivibacter halophilus]